MHWLTYSHLGKGIFALRIVESETRPIGITVIDGGFEQPDEALKIMQEYFKVEKDGYLQLDRSRVVEFPMGWFRLALERIRFAYWLAPYIVWWVLLLSIADAVIAIVIMLHLAGSI